MNFLNVVTHFAKGPTQNIPDRSDFRVNYTNITRQPQK